MSSIRYIYKDFKFYIKSHGLIETIFNFGFWTLINYRIGRFLIKKKIFKITLLWYFYLFLKNLLTLVSKIEIPPTCKVGSNINLVHPYGLVMGNNVEIGNNCTIGAWVVIGHNGDKAEQPKIGNNVYLAPHCCLLGGILIGNNVLIGANTVVTRDITSNSIVKNSNTLVIKKKK